MKFAAVIALLVGAIARGYAGGVYPKAPSSVGTRITRTALLVSSTALPLLVGLSRTARSKTFIDIDVYGDKELRIAALNKLKQKIRNGILKNVSVAPLLLKAAINDALGFSAVGGAGGPDGSIAYELDREDNASLTPAVELLQNVKRDLQRTVSFSLADVCAVGGAEALESAGCPRVTVQLGRYDAKSANAKQTMVRWGAPTASTVFEAFRTSGLTVRDTVLLIGAVCEMERIASLAGESQENSADAQDSFEKKPYVPQSFGARDATFGEKIGSSDFGSTYFAALQRGAVAGDSLGKCLLSDSSAKALVAKYAENAGAFRSDVVDAYQKMTQLGESYITRNS